MYWFTRPETSWGQRDRGLFARLGRSSRLLFESLTGEENPTRLLGELTLLVLLLHVWIIESIIDSREPTVPAQPLVMDVSLIAASVEKPKAAAPVVKQQPAPKSPKKVRLPPKKTPLALIPRKAPVVPAPAAAPESVASKPQSSQTQTSSSSASPAAAGKKNIKSDTETFTEARYQPNYRNNPAPEYPRIARKRGWEGTVLLLIQVTREGHCANVTVHRTSGHESLDKAAVEATRKWTFIPAKRGETPVASSVIVPIRFTLSKS
ncbi:MAG: energy transducer TonB [Methylococcales bacterium]